MIKINFFNQYDDQKIYLPVIKKVIKTAYAFLDIKETKTINVILVNNESIHEMNLYYRQIDRPTDVLSFENQDEEDELGDIFISIDKAKEQALEYGHSFDRELAFLSVHGFLHCNGYDHLTKEEEKEMFDLQDQILNLTSYTR
ncbi:MAG: rRNA maturation RNase YbeY [Candidatus Izemoplasmatales bacterium]